MEYQESKPIRKNKVTTPHETSTRAAGDRGMYLEDNRSIETIQQKSKEITENRNINAPIQKKENNTGLPDDLKSGIENLSGYAMDDVKVHYNSDKPTQLNAHAYAQGTDIHLASGQEKHLAHEAWHVVQQKQGRVQPTKQLKSKVNINDDEELEKEADVMGVKALQMKSISVLKQHKKNNSLTREPIQMITDEEHQAMYGRFQKPLGLRFQSGEELPKKTISGDQYGLQDDRYGPDKVDAEKYTEMLNSTIDRAVGKQGGWFASDNKLTLGETFDKIRSEGQLAIMAPPIPGWRKDYGKDFGSVGKREINPEDFLIRIPLINVWDYEKYDYRLDETWKETWFSKIWPEIVDNVKSRVADAITLSLGGKLDKYNLGPDFDPDPKPFLAEMNSLFDDIQDDDIDYL